MDNLRCRSKVDKNNGDGASTLAQGLDQHTSVIKGVKLKHTDIAFTVCGPIRGSLEAAQMAWVQELHGGDWREQNVGENDEMVDPWTRKMSK